MWCGFSHKFALRYCAAVTSAERDAILATVAIGITDQQYRNVISLCKKLFEYWHRNATDARTIRVAPDYFTATSGGLLADTIAFLPDLYKKALVQRESA